MGAHEDVPHGLSRAESTSECLAKVALLHALGAFGEHDEIRMTQVEHEIFGAGIAGVGFRFETPQNDLLQIRRYFGP